MPWVAITGVLDDRPAVLARQIGQQPMHKPADPPAGLNTGEPARYPSEQQVGFCFPTHRSYAVAHGHRLII
jgi:hypothetical protein